VAVEAVVGSRPVVRLLAVLDALALICWVLAMSPERAIDMLLIRDVRDSLNGPATVRPHL
jgi:hypothetical protein